MTVLKVPEMHCEMCVKHITDALTAAKLDFSVSLNDQTVSVNGDEHAVEKAVSELDEIGFSAER